MQLGEDVIYQSSELNNHGPTVKGWRSSKNCDYPQQLVLKLSETTIIHQIQILAHQYLIRKYLYEYENIIILPYHIPILPFSATEN